MHKIDYVFGTRGRSTEELPGSGAESGASVVFKATCWGDQRALVGAWGHLRAPEDGPFGGIGLRTSGLGALGGSARHSQAPALAPAALSFGGRLRGPPGTFGWSHTTICEYLRSSSSGHLWALVAVHLWALASTCGPALMGSASGRLRSDAGTCGRALVGMHEHFRALGACGHLWALSGTQGDSWALVRSCWSRVWGGGERRRKALDLRYG